MLVVISTCRLLFEKINKIKIKKNLRSINPLALLYSIQIPLYEEKIKRKRERKKKECNLRENRKDIHFF
jgi:hypothetical protein